MNVSEFIADYLSKKNIKNIFLVTGGGMMFLTDALSKKKIKLIFNHHEQASFFSTDGYARASGKTGVCFATSGPGVTNLITGILSSWQDSVPILIIGGQCKTKETIQYSNLLKLRQHGTFEANSLELLKPITKYSQRVDDANRIKFYLDKAFYIANEGRPGPVFLEVPLDIQSANINLIKIKQNIFFPKKNKNKKVNLKSIVNRINKSRRPVILVGYGIRASNAVDVFRKFIKEIKIPVITTQFAKDVMYYDNPCFIGHSGPKGDRAANKVIQESDLILIIGCSLHSQTIGWEHNLFAPKAFKIQIDVDSSVLKKNFNKINRKKKMSVEYFIKNIREHKFYLRNNSWLKYCSNLKKRFQVIKEPHVRNKKKMNYYDLIFNLSKILPDKTIVVTDAGAAYYILGQTFNLKKHQRYIVPGSHGTMGYALSAANGASCYGQNVICITGDGSLMTNLHDLSVTSVNKFNNKIFIINNGGYMSIRNSQKEFFKNRFGTDIDTGLFIPNYKNISKTFNLPYIACHSIFELKKIVKNIFRKKGPIIIECFVDNNQEIIPTIKSKLNSEGELIAQSLDNMYPENKI